MKPIVSAALFIIYPYVWCGLDALSGRFLGALWSETGLKMNALVKSPPWSLFGVLVVTIAS
jgi:hypothetical protein